MFLPGHLLLVMIYFPEVTLLLVWDRVHYASFTKRAQPQRA